MKPILFNTEMVRALLSGRKTVTRRVVKPPVMNTIVTPPLRDTNKPGYWAFYGEDGLRHAPYRPGDILYVRETWMVNSAWNGSYTGCEIEYKAGGIQKFDEIIALPTKKGEWRPSIHMPREAARIFLRVTDVRVERLQGIGPEQLRKEGFFLSFTPSECKRMFDRFGAVKSFEREKEKFAALWNSTIKKTDRALYSWDANPWVWVIEFERISREEVLNHDA